MAFLLIKLASKAIEAATDDGSRNPAQSQTQQQPMGMGSMSRRDLKRYQKAQRKQLRRGGGPFSNQQYQQQYQPQYQFQYQYADNQRRYAGAQYHEQPRSDRYEQRYVAPPPPTRQAVQRPPQDDYELPPPAYSSAPSRPSQTKEAYADERFSQV